MSRPHTLLGILALGAHAALAQSGPQLLHKWNGNSNFDEFGKTVASAGDVNADGWPDLLVGAWKDDPGGTDSGALSVLSGRDGAVIRTHAGNGTNQFFGFALASLGDVNGDGRSEYAAGTYNASAGAGLVIVFDGATGLALWARTGAAGDNLGYAMAGIGDINGDGVPDLAVGQLEDGASGSRRGRVLLLHGATGVTIRSAVPTSGFRFGQSVAAAGDVDGDLVPDLVVGNPDVNSAYLVSGATGVLLRTHTGAGLFGKSVAGLGDVNGDGRGDYAVGAPNQAPSGSVTVFSGATGGILWARPGQAAGDQFGAAIAGAGDVDGNGVRDLIVGAPLQDEGNVDTGAAWTFDGRTGAIIEVVRAPGTVEGARLFGSSVAGAGDVNHDGHDDVIIGAPNEGFGSTPDFGSASVFAVRRFVDSTPPTVTIAVPANNAVVGTTSVFVFASVVDQSTTTVTSSPTGVSASLPITGGNVSGAVPLANEGTNTITVTATDSFNNVGGASVTVIRDTIAPTVRIVAPAPNTVFGLNPVAISVEVTDATASIAGFGGNSIPLPAGGGVATGNVFLAEGLNTVLVNVVDAAGNPTQQTVDLILDLTAPVVTILSPADGASFGPGNSPLPVTASVDDLTETTVSSSPAGVAGTLPPGGGILPGAVPLVEGYNTIQVTAEDAAARTTSSHTVTVLYDTTPPVVAVTSPEDGALVRGIIDLNATASDVSPGAGLQKVEFFDGTTLLATRTAAPFELQIDTATLADGAHTLRVVATDAVGNDAPAQISVVIDNTPPEITIAAPAANAVVTGTIPFSVDASDATSGLVAVTMLAGGVAPSVDASTTFAPAVPSALRGGQEDTTRWPDGALTFTARAVDAAGNQSTVTVEVQVSNAQPPSCSLTPADQTVARGTVPLVATVTSGSFARIEVRVDGVTVAAGTTSPLSLSFDTTQMLDGTLRVEAVVTDLAGGQITCTSFLTIDNMQILRVTPGTLDINPRCKYHDDHLTKVRVEGVNVGLLMPVTAHQVELRVPGATPVPAVRSWHGHDGLVDGDNDNVPELRIRFDSKAVVGAIRAGIAAGAIDTRPRHVDVPVTLWVDGREIGGGTIRINGHESRR